MVDTPSEPSAEERYATPLPKQIRDQLAQADEVRRTALPEPPADPNGEGEGEGGGEGGDGEGGGDPGDGGGGEGEGAGAQFEEPPVDEDTWEQRARSTYGRLEQALNSNTQLARRIGELENTISTLRIGGASAPAAPAPAAQPQRYVKETEVQEYGDEFFDVVGRRAREVYSPELDALSQRVKRLESGQQAVGEVVQRTQKRTVYDALGEAVPNWKEINHHPAFHTWLSYPDLLSGRPRQQMLQEAFAGHDARRVVAFFQGFLTEATGTPPEAPSPGSSAPPLPNGQRPAPPNGNGSGKPSLEDYAAPGRARSAPQPLPPDKPVYTQAQIARFADDKRRGKFRGREAEAEAIERDIFAAQHEGRIF